MNTFEGRLELAEVGCLRIMQWKALELTPDEVFGCLGRAAGWLRIESSPSVHEEHAKADSIAPSELRRVVCPLENLDLFGEAHCLDLNM